MAVSERISKPRAIEAGLTILVCQRTDRIIRTSQNADTQMSIKTIIDKAMRAQPWKIITSNSSEVAQLFSVAETDKHGRFLMEGGALQIPVEETQDKFRPEEVCRYLWGIDHVLALWSGEDQFQEVLEAVHRMKRKYKLYVPDEKGKFIRVRPDYE